MSPSQVDSSYPYGRLWKFFSSEDAKNVIRWFFWQIWFRSKQTNQQTESRQAGSRRLN